MPRFWEHLGRGSETHHRNLQDGLFQIASHTCSLLVQVNNTNNISYGHHATNVLYNNLHAGGSSSSPRGSRSDPNRDQLVVLLPPSHPKGPKYKPGVLGRPRLSTVLESPSHHEEEADIFSQTFSLPGEVDPSGRWGKKSAWCKPSCIPITVILILIFLVVLLPLLDHGYDKEEVNSHSGSTPCSKSCRFSLVESIPEGMKYPNGSTPHPSTYLTWLKLIESAESSIEIGSFYWTLRYNESYPDPSSIQGEHVFDALLKAGTQRKIKIKIAQNIPSRNYPNTDTEYLAKKKAAEVRSLNFLQWFNSGVLHTKLWVIDRKHFYVGSANLDWRALTEVKEMGVVVYNCSCLAEDIAKIFEVYWYLGKKGAKIPNSWPAALSTRFNQESPMNLTSGDNTFPLYIASSPPNFCPKGRTSDIDAILNVIQKAEKFVYISVMDYEPLRLYEPKIKFWSVIDNALRSVAIDHKIQVRLLISWWNHSLPAETNFLKSLSDMTVAYPRTSIEVRRFVVPANESQSKIPFARVNHNKYMVTDNTAYIGTSNWSGDYFINTGGVGFVMEDPEFPHGNDTIRQQLQMVFERDWNSPYATTSL